jgi:hypothetical protein
MLKAIRQPTLWTSRTNGVEAAVFPRVPMEMVMLVRVAKMTGKNHRVISLKVPISLQAMPTPISTRPTTPADNEPAQAKITAPKTATIEKRVMARLGSRAKAKKNGRDDPQFFGVKRQVPNQKGNDHRIGSPVKLGGQKHAGRNNEYDPSVKHLFRISFPASKPSLEKAPEIFS